MTFQTEITHNKALVRMQTTLRFVCTAQLKRYPYGLGSNTMKRLSVGVLCLIFLFFHETSLADKYAMFEQNSYAKNIDIRAYILKKDQICTLINDAEVVQLNYKELWGNDIYLAVQIKNTGNLTSWGKLLCSINKREPIGIEVQLLGRRMEHYLNYLIPVNGILPPHLNQVPEIELNWFKIYTY